MYDSGYCVASQRGRFRILRNAYLLEGKRIAEVLPDRLMVGHRPLEASILVRVQVRQLGTDNPDTMSVRVFLLPLVGLDSPQEYFLFSSFFVATKQSRERRRRYTRRGGTTSACRRVRVGGTQ